VLACADSRLSPEIIFDQGIGDPFVVRVGGNTAAAPEVQGSIEYGVAELHARLVVVLGHG
jgi:carbonic anhydrase